MSGLPTLSIVVIVPTMVISSSSSSYAAVVFVIVKVKDDVRSDQCATENFRVGGDTTSVLIVIVP